MARNTLAPAGSVPPIVLPPLFVGCRSHAMILHNPELGAWRATWRLGRPGVGVWAKKAFGHAPWRVTWALNVLARAPILMAQADVMSLHSVPG